MANYLDCQLTTNDKNGIKSYNSEISIMLAVKNLLLGAPGNWPFDPEMGVDIEQYQFEFADNRALDKIRGKINAQVNKYIPSLDGIDVNVSVVQDDKTPYRYQLYVSISGHITGINKNIEIPMLISKDQNGAINIVSL